MLGTFSNSPDPLDSDLLQPTLTEEHDAQGFGRPNDPQSIPFLAFFAGPIGAGYFVVSNFRQLGMQRHAVRWTVVFAVTTLFCLGFSVYAFRMRMAMSTPRLLTQGLCAGLAYLAANQQKNRFRVFEFQEDTATPMWKKGLLGVAGGLLLYWGLLSIALKFGASL